MLVPGVSNKALGSIVLIMVGVIWAANNTDFGRKYLGGGSGFFGL